MNVVKSQTIDCDNCHCGGEVKTGKKWVECPKCDGAGEMIVISKMNFDIMHTIYKNALTETQSNRG